MRLATLDVLNSMDGNAEASPNVMQTLDRIIACPKLAMSRHTCPLIEVSKTCNSVLTSLSIAFMTDDCHLHDHILLKLIENDLLRSLNLCYNFYFYFLTVFNSWIMKYKKPFILLIPPLLMHTEGQLWSASTEKIFLDASSTSRK